MKKMMLLSVLMTSYGCAASTEILPAWNDTPARQAIVKWVQDTTREGSPDFIPPDKRYVVFDNDGTLWPEAPLTFQLQFAVDEIRRMAPEHPEWQQDPIVKAVLKNDLKSVAASGDKGLLKLLSLTHSGVTTETFRLRVTNWLNRHADNRTGCRYDQMGYQPMRQLLDYLRANGFKTWIVSGGGIDFMRVMSERMYGIPPEQVIGSFALSDYALTDKGITLTKTLKGAFNDDGDAKPVAIHLFMGRRPVAAFGNSDGDLAMLRYATGTPEVRTFGLLVHHTDEVREYAYDAHPSASGKLVKGMSLAKEKGWTVVDMKQDWKTVFDPQRCRAQ